MIRILLALVASTVPVSAQGVIHRFIDPSCDSVALVAPINATPDSVNAALKRIGMTSASNERGTEAFTTASGNMSVIVSYKQGKSHSIFLYLKYEHPQEAADAATVVNTAIERSHGEADPKTHYFYRRCEGITYMLRAYAPTLSTGSYLCLTMIIRN